MTTLNATHPVSHPAAGRSPGVTRMGHMQSPRFSLFDLLVTWQRRFEERRALAEMDPRMLRDVGLDRAMIDAETQKPVWRA